MSDHPLKRRDRIYRYALRRKLFKARRRMKQAKDDQDEDKIKYFQGAIDALSEAQGEARSILRRGH